METAKSSKADDHERLTALRSDLMSPEPAKVVLIIRCPVAGNLTSHRMRKVVNSR
ncbi:hypothetical protein GA0061098_10633 [Bradyrhizobium shewense]|uniref:Uncharacterized protein n=1 Tax=Bradyrhizobium shewense TaxID=1761772 RepID=A0A1C3XUS7_9BRAD|nr:hypothetical protein GA0061098_10633 [Bradyrhizobium shewense]